MNRGKPNALIHQPLAKAVILWTARLKLCYNVFGKVYSCMRGVLCDVGSETECGFLHGSVGENDGGGTG
jgi:hypothetical protein